MLLELVDNWKVFVDIGWCYVCVVGDYNLIYLLVFSVKLFGFFCVIVYGLWNKVCSLVVFGE